MSHHLNNAQISALVCGEPSPESAAHLENCALCKGEVEQFESLLGRVNGSGLIALTGENNCEGVRDESLIINKQDPFWLERNRHYLDPSKLDKYADA